MSGYWDWIEAAEREALAEGNLERIRLCLYHSDAFQFRESDPDQAIALYQEGKRLAHVLGEKWWELYYSHWCAQALMHFKRDYRDVLDLTVANALEVRKEIYDEFPQRIAIYQDLIAAYEGIDVEGYLDRIQQAFETIEESITPELQSRRHSLESHRRDVALQLEDYPTALEAGLRGLKHVDEERNASTGLHYATFVYAGLCEAAYPLGRWEELEEWASQGVEVSRQVGHKMEIAALLTWQAVALRHRGEEESALACLFQAYALVQRVKMSPTSGYFEALSSFHEMAGTWDYAFAVREQELHAIQGWGQLYYECQVRLKRCRLLAKLRLPLEQEAEATRQAAARLLKPERSLQRLETILSDADRAPNR